MLWEGYLAPGNVTLLTSQWKAGKTTLLAHLLRQMGAGGDLLGLPVRPGRAVVVSEEPEAMWDDRARRLGIGDHVRWACRPFGDAPPSPAQFTALIDEVLALHAEAPLALAVVDSLAAFLTARSESDADGVMRALDSTLKACTACHETFRQQVVDEATWTTLTSSQTP